jgi:DNA-binding CsgD family transcriptional regulator
VPIRARRITAGEVDAAAFWAGVDRRGDDECWPWLKAIRKKDGYGHSRWGRAHRVAYALEHGAAPADLLVLHRCDNRVCCNPAHLWLGTQAENMRDRDSKGRGVVPEDGRPRLLTPEQHEEVWSSSESSAALAARLGVGEETVRLARTRNPAYVVGAYQINKVNMARARAVRCLELRRQGMTNDAIAEREGTTGDAVANLLSRARLGRYGLEWVRAPYPTS